MKKITNAQISKIHVLLTQFNLLEQKKTFVYQFSHGRAASTKDLSMEEARELLSYLSQFDPCDRMRRKIFALAYTAGIIYGDTLEDKKINAAKLNMFLREKGSIKKNLTEMNKDELIKTVSQFQQIVKHRAEQSAARSTKMLLSELNIESSFGKLTKHI